MRAAHGSNRMKILYTREGARLLKPTLDAMRPTNLFFSCPARDDRRQRAVMRFRLYSLVGVIILLQLCCIRQTDGIIGSVVDSNTLQPIPGAKVAISTFDFQGKQALKEDQIVYTDDRGIYQWFYAGTMLLVNGGGIGYPDKVKITVEKAGYQIFTSPNFISLNDTVTYNVKLSP